MIKKIVSVSVGVAVWAVFAAEGVRPQPELIGTVDVAAFSDFQKKVVDLGTTINNPAAPMLAVPAVQSMLTEQFGKFRQDAAMKLLCYANVAALRKAIIEDGDDDIDNAVEVAFLYPCAEGADAFLVNHPEAKKAADGVIELEDGNVVLFASDGRTCAFASNAGAAKRALAAAPAPAACPLIRMNVTEVGLGLLADLHQKLAASQESLAQVAGGTNETDRLVSSCLKFQQAQMKRQNAVLRMFAQATMSMDLDETGFVVKGSVTAKPGAAVSPAAGFKLPAGVLDAIPAKAPLFGAANPFLYANIHSEQEYRALLGEVRDLIDYLFACLRQKTPDYVQVVDGLRAATADLLTTAPCPGPADWSVGALAFGPRQEPYMLQSGESATATQGRDAAVRFYAALADAIGKKWPGILLANGATLSVDWARLIDAVAAAAGATPEEQAQVAAAKKNVAAILGGTVSEVSTVLPTPTTYRTFVGTKGFTPPAAAPSGERRFAAAVPEAAANRPGGVFYLSLYALVRDNVLPLVVKVLPKQQTAQFQAIVSALPPAGANGAIAGATWYEKNGSCSFLLRITKDEIRNYGAAANAIMSAQMAE
jgi:hypothetical protein